MSTETYLALLLDSPMQSWGHTSRFERRTTALHPTRSAVLGLIAAALGINKHAPDEASRLAKFASLKITTVSLPRRDRYGRELLIQRLEDYHTVTGIRRASGKVDDDATVQTYRHYLLDARFGVLIDGPVALTLQINIALNNPRWGVWLGRKCCVPSSPILVTMSSDRFGAWYALLKRAGYSGTEQEQQFDRIVETLPVEPGAEIIEDAPVGFGKPIGERHAPRWIRRISKLAVQKMPS